MPRPRDAGPPGRDPSGALDQARSGIRASTPELEQRGRGKLAPAAAAAAVAAAACLPLVWPVLPVAASQSVSVAVVASALTQIGSVSVNLVSEGIVRAWDAIRGEGEITRTQLRLAVQAHLEDRITNSAEGSTLRREVAGILDRTNAVEIVLDTPNPENLVRSLYSLGNEFQEFSFLIGRLQLGIADILRSVSRTEATARVTADLQRQMQIDLMLLRQEYGPGNSRTSTARAGPADTDFPAATGLVDHRNPYPGLQPYDVGDEARFFGRERLTASMLANLNVLTKKPGVLVLTGVSGAGKSSVLRAGLLPALAAGALPYEGAGTWPRVSMTPGDDPLGRLSTVLATMANTDPEGLRSDLERDPRRVQRTLEQIQLRDRYRWDVSSDQTVFIDSPTGRGDGFTILIIDQFEEAFTHSGGEQLAAFMSVLAAAANVVSLQGPSVEPTDDTHPRILLIISIRADFLGQLAAFPAIASQAQERQILVGPLDEQGLREAIDRPAAAQGVVIDGELTQRMMEDLRGTGTGQPGRQAVPGLLPTYEPGRLPLLNYTLQRLWAERASPERISHDDYLAIGGVDGAVATAADGIFDTMSDSEQDATRRIMLRLVSLRPGLPDSRRRASRSELTSESGTDGASLADSALSKLIEARLVTADEEGVELTHEALLRAWPRLKNWITADRAGLEVHRQLTEAADVWNRLNRDPNVELRGARLEQAIAWAHDHPADLNSLERDFLTISRTGEALMRRSERRRTRRLQISVIVSVTRLVAAIAAGSAAFAQREDARRAQKTSSRQAEVATSRQLAAQSTGLINQDPDTASLLAVEAYRAAATDEAQAALEAAQNLPGRAVIRTDDDTVFGVAFSPDGRRVAVTSKGDVIVADSRTGRTLRILPGPDEDYLMAVEFSPDGKYLASAGYLGKIKIRKVTTGALVQQLQVPGKDGGNQIYKLAFDRKGDSVLASGFRPWLCSRHGQKFGSPEPVPRGAGAAAFVGTHGDLIIAGNDKNLRSWSPETGESRPLLHVSKRVLDMDISADGKYIAATGDGNDVRVWSTDGHLISQIKNPTGSPEATGFSPDGHNLAIVGGKAVKIVDYKTGKTVQSLVGHQGFFTHSLAYAKDGRLITGGDGDARVWAPTDALNSVTYRLLRTAVTHMIWQPGGRLVASSSTAGDLVVWDPLNGKALWRIPASPNPQEADALDIAFTPDGKELQVTVPHRRSSTNIRVYGTATGDVLRRLRDVDRTIFRVCSPDLRFYLAEKDYGTGEVQARDALSHRTLRTLTAKKDGIYIFISSNGRYLAVTGPDKQVDLWDTRTWDRLAALAVPNSANDANHQVDFSQDGRFAAIAAEDENSVVLYDLQRHKTSHLVGHTDYVRVVRFNPTGDLLATTGDDRQIRLWSTASGRVIRVIRSPKDEVRSLDFSQDGHLLVLGLPGGRVRVMDTAFSPRPAIADLCLRVHRQLSPNQWEQYLPGRHYRRSCP